jgi:hypothetical protein
MGRSLLSLAFLALSATAAPAAAQSDDQPYVFQDSRNLQDRQAAFRTLDGYLKRIGSGARVASCKTLLWSHPGTVEGIYVGDCRLTNHTEVVMCGDTGIGEFALSWSEGGGRDRLITFAHANCPGG